MGNLLDVPILTPLTEKYFYKNKNISFYSIQGYRLHMEDFYSFYKDKRYLYFGIFDGHGGAYVSTYLRDKFLPFISNRFSKINIDNIDEKKITKIINELYLKFDFEIYSKIIFNKTQGSTAICIIMSNQKTIIIHCGDSKSIVYNGKNIIYKTLDFKPNNEIEKRRILNSNHTVRGNRIDGVIDISRCFGDFVFKRVKNNKIDISSAIIPLPGIKIINNKNIKFIASISDGISNMINDELLVSYIEYNLQLNISLIEISENIVKYCIYKQGTDNMTISLIVFYKYDFNHNLSLTEKEELEIIYKIVTKKIKTELENFKPFSIFKLFNLMRYLERDNIIKKLTIDIGFRSIFIENVYKSIIC